MSTIIDKFRIDKQVVVITGGGGLLGQQYARAVAEAGGIPVVTDINEKAALKVASEIQQKNAKALGLYVDVADKMSVEALVKLVVEKFGRIDGLINNAGIDPKFEGQEEKKRMYAFEDYPQELWNKSLDVNLTGMFLCSQAVAPVMLEQGKGTIVNISSIYGLVGPDQRIYKTAKSKKPTYKPVDYSTTKSAVLGLTRYLATYWAGKGIRVNAFTPGGVFNNHSKEFVKNYSSRTVLGRMAKKDEYNASIVFLLSDASSYMTGGNLILDGGWTAW